MNLGNRPTFSGESLRLEVHLLDDGAHDLYGKNLWVEVVDHIRPEERFSHIDMLKTQISKDIQTAKKLLADIKPELMEYPC
jgi:riboflavin kinase/FMN adenylyltransferase